MPLISRFEDIHAWQEARKSVKMIYNLTDSGAFSSIGYIDERQFQEIYSNAKDEGSCRRIQTPSYKTCVTLETWHLTRTLHRASTLAIS